MNIDPTASLKRWAVTVDLGGRRWRIPPHGAGVWLQALRGSYSQVVPGLLELDSDDQDELLDMLMDGRLRIDECREAARDAIGAVSGMKWWAATRLASYLMQEWGTLGGALLTRGIDLETQPLGAVLTISYRLLLENCKGEPERQKLDIELMKVPPGVAIEQMIDQRAATAAAMALMGADGG